MDTRCKISSSSTWVTFPSNKIRQSHLSNYPKLSITRGRMNSKFKQIFGILLVAQLSNSLLLHLVAVLLFHGHSLFKCLKCRNRICWTLPLMKKRCFKCLFALFQSGHLLQQCFSVPNQHLSIARAAAVSWYSNLKTSCDHFFVYGSGPPSSASLRTFSLGWQCHPEIILWNQDSQKTN